MWLPRLQAFWKRCWCSGGIVVAKGQVLATLRAGVEKADLEQASALLEFNRRKLVRNKELVAQGNVSANDEDEMATEIKKDEAILHQVAAKLEMKTIRSPVDGVVVKVDLSAGEYVGEKPIMTIAQIDPLNVEVVVPVSEYGTIKKGHAGGGPAGVSRGRRLHWNGHDRRPRGERRERQLWSQSGAAQSQSRDPLWT
jgi:multidrug efflux pump subunit AcrA (membrane-fusion protein)